MSFLKVGSVPNSKRRLYLFDITLKSGLKVVKIGVASHSSSVDRMFQVNRDYYIKTRESFKCSIKRDREVPSDQCFSMEATLHKFFRHYQYNSPVKFDGCTELFCIPLDAAVQAFEAVIDGLIPDHTYELPGMVDSNKYNLPF